MFRLLILMIFSIMCDAGTDNLCVAAGYAKRLALRLFTFSNSWPLHKASTGLQCSNLGSTDCSMTMMCWSGPKTVLPTRTWSHDLSAGIGDRLCSGDLTFDVSSRTSLSASAARYQRTYETRFGFESGYYDLSQNPDFCARACRSEDPLFTLTTNSAHIWSTTKCRFLSGNELGAAQGLPTHPAIAAAMGSVMVDFSGYKPSVWVYFENNKKNNKY